MILRLDVIFELAYLILVMYNASDYASLAFTVTIPLAIFFSIIFVREAIARESHILMVLFYCAQATLIGAVISILVFKDEYGDGIGAFFFTYWYAFAIYSKLRLEKKGCYNILTFTFIYLAIMALLFCLVRFIFLKKKIVVYLLTFLLLLFKYNHI
jgi:hypothetical protein